MQMHLEILNNFFIGNIDWARTKKIPKIKFKVYELETQITTFFIQYACLFSNHMIKTRFY